MPSVFFPLAIGWEMVMLFGWISKKWPIILKVVLSIVGALIYCWLFVLFNWLMIPMIDIYKYIIADIPFEIVLMTSSGISVALLYIPIYNIANKGYNFDKVKENKLEINEEEPLL